jgi:hypothetical protein
MTAGPIGHYGTKILSLSVEERFQPRMDLAKGSRM